MNTQAAFNGDYLPWIINFHSMLIDSIFTHDTTRENLESDIYGRENLSMRRNFKPTIVSTMAVDAFYVVSMYCNAHLCSRLLLNKSWQKIKI